MSNELGISDDQHRLFSIFHPYALAKTVAAMKQNQRFVYYTSADTAMRILQNGEIWMRKSHQMNDYREIEHGFDCLNGAYKQHKERMLTLFDGMFPGFCERLETTFNGWLPHFRMDSYITCLSEHDPSEDQYGRLSMWRAYGGAAGVALVVNGGPIWRASDALRAFASPVAYLDASQTEAEFSRLLSNIESNREYLSSLGEQQIQNRMFAAMRSAILCTKHPGFHEEREWRVIYSPTFQRSERITSSIESIGGIPQSICRIPLRDVPDEGLHGLAPADLIDRVIIGPSKYPAGIYDALLVLLADVGVANPGSKIIFSEVPLRQ